MATYLPKPDTGGVSTGTVVKGPMGDYLVGSLGRNHLVDVGNTAEIYGGRKCDDIWGSDLDNFIFAGDGDNFVEPGRGEDSVSCGAGNDAYRHYGINDGHDTITDMGGNRDRIQFIGINSENLMLQRVADDLVFWTTEDGKYGTRHDLVTIENHFSVSGKNKIESLLLGFDEKYFIDDLTQHLVLGQSFSVFRLLSTGNPGQPVGEGEIVPPVLPVSPASGVDFLLAQDDLNNPITHLYYSDQLSDFFEELQALEQRYGFEARKESGMYLWTEDNMWLSADGRIAFQPQKPVTEEEMSQYWTFITALDADILGAEEEGHHSVGNKDAQGQTAERMDPANNLVVSRNLKMIKTLSVIDGGNMLTGRRADGKPYVLIGRDAVLQTTLRHNYLDRERVAARVEAMQADGLFTLVLEDEGEDYGVFREGFDAEIDLILLEAADLVPQGLDRPARLAFARSTRAKAELALERDALTPSTDFGNQMSLSPDQMIAIKNRYWALYNGRLSGSFDMSDQIKKDYGTLAVARQLAPLYSDALIEQKLTSWQPSSEAINRMVIMLKRAGFIRQSLTDKKAQQQAVRFLAMNEISRDIMADELNIPTEDLVIVSQQEFHIDMFLRPLSDGRVLMHDYEESRKLVQAVLDDQNNELTVQNKKDLQKTVFELQQLHQQRQSISVLIGQQLQNAGLEVIKAPGVFSVGERGVNYMNGMMGISQKDNVIFYITNASTVEALNVAFSGWIQKQQPGLKVEFVGRVALGEDNELDAPPGFNLAEALLGYWGGFDCATLHHGVTTETRLLVQQMVTFTAHTEDVSTQPATSTVTGALLPSYSISNNRLASV